MAKAVAALLMRAAGRIGYPYLAGFGDCASVSPTPDCEAAAAAFLPLPWPLGLTLLHKRSKQPSQQTVLCSLAQVRLLASSTSRL